MRVQKVLVTESGFRVEALLSFAASENSLGVQEALVSFESALRLVVADDGSEGQRTPFISSRKNRNKSELNRSTALHSGKVLYVHQQHY